MNSNDEKKVFEAELALNRGKLTADLVEDMPVCERLKLARKIIRQAGGWFYQDTYPTGIVSLKLQGHYRVNNWTDMEAAVRLLSFRVTYTKKDTRSTTAGTPRYQFLY